jgi:hypothetical protein
MSLDLQSISRRALAVAFGLAASLLRPVVFKKITGYTQNLSGSVTVTDIATAVCNALVVSYQSRDVDGSSIKYGDEKWIVRGSELSAISPLPSSGDWFEEFGRRVDIVAALLDATQQVWIFQVRKQVFDPTVTVSSSVDWGASLATGSFDSSEDFADLSLAFSGEDWNS